MKKTVMKSGQIWDLPLRVFHWLLLLSVVAAFISVKVTGNMFVHEKAGLTALGLILFRLIWGFVGGHHARFHNFITRPSAVIAYINSRRNGDRHYQPGHAPTGAYATVVILSVLLLMASLGLMANDDVLYEGPLAAFVGDFTNQARQYHHNVSKLVIVMIIIHLAAIAIYRFKLKIKLIPAMVHGGKDDKTRRLSGSYQLFGLTLMAACIAASQSIGLIGDRFY